MNLITNCKLFSYTKDSNTVEHQTLKDDNNSKNTKTDSKNCNINSNSNISEDAKINYDFFKSIGDSVKDVTKTPFLDKYIEEYEKIKNEISCGKYGKDVKKYETILENSFKAAINNAFKILNNEVDKITKTISTSNTENKKLPLRDLLKCQKQYETATGLTWMFRAENKRIQQEIEYYKRKKNYRKVNSLTELSKSYNRIINNVSAAADFIQGKINDSFSSDTNKDTSQETEIQSQNK